MVDRSASSLLESPITRPVPVDAGQFDSTGTGTDRSPGAKSGKDHGFLLRMAVGLSNVHRRMLAVCFGLLGPEIAYALTQVAARCLYHLLPPLRQRSEAQCQAALSPRFPREDIIRIAKEAFIHRVWNLTDLMLAERLLHHGTYRRFGGQIPQPHLARLQQAPKHGQPTILLTGYYGPFDLWPLFLGFNGIRAGVVYRPHENAGFDEYRKRVRSRSGCELIPVGCALGRLEKILSAGGVVAIVADHHTRRRGIPATFLGLPTTVRRSVGVLACHYQADVVVAGIRRIGKAFRFELVVTDIIERCQWQQQDDPVAHVTRRYLRGLEKIVLDDPTQYLWGYPRWGEELAQKLVEREMPAWSKALT